MIPDEYATCTAITNILLSNALAIESMILAHIDDDAPDLLGAISVLAGDQLNAINNLRNIETVCITSDVNNLNARCVGVVYMTETLEKNIENDSNHESIGYLQEAILTMVKTTIKILKTICCKTTNL